MLRVETFEPMEVKVVDSELTETGTMKAAILNLEAKVADVVVVVVDLVAAVDMWQNGKALLYYPSV